MNVTKSLFSKRLINAWTDGLRYFRVIAGNSGIPILLLLIVSGFTHGYISLLNTLPHGLPTIALLAGVTATVLTPSAVRTFLHSADQVFLGPLQDEMRQYVRLSLLYNGGLHAVRIIVALFAMYPFIVLRLHHVNFPFILCIAVVIKLWNVYAAWLELHLRNGQAFHWWIRFIVNGLLSFLLFYGGNPLQLSLLIGIVLVLFTVYYRRFQTKGYFPWFDLLAIEQKKKATLYKLASLFIDVPHVDHVVRKRKWLSGLLSLFRVSRQQTHFYLYVRTFLRSEPHFGMYSRLTTVTGIAIYFLSNPYAVVVVYIASLFLTGIQLPAVWTRHRDTVWMRLYPIPKDQSRASLSKLALITLILQSLITLTGQWLTGPFWLTLLYLLLGVLLSYWISYSYLPKKLQRMERN